MNPFFEVTTPGGENLKKTALVTLLRCYFICLLNAVGKKSQH